MNKRFLTSAAAALLAIAAVATASLNSAASSSLTQLSGPSPTANYVAPTDPSLSDDAINQIALREATAAHDPTATITAVNTTLKNAVATGEDSTMTGSEPGEVALANSSVVLVTMHGFFTLDNAPVKRGSPAPAGKVLTIAIDDHTGFVDLRRISPAESPVVAQLGPARLIQ